VKLVRYADRPELIDRRERLSGSFPTYMHHNEPGGRYWARLYDGTRTSSSGFSTAKS
jgi:hypothetical protein